VVPVGGAAVAPLALASALPLALAAVALVTQLSLLTAPINAVGLNISCPRRRD